MCETEARPTERVGAQELEWMLSLWVGIEA